MVPVLDALRVRRRDVREGSPCQFPSRPVERDQLASDAAVHVQLPEAFVTVTANEPPPAGAACVAAARL